MRWSQYLNLKGKGMLWSVLVLFCCGTSFAQMGLTPISQKEYDALPRWVPDPEGVGEFFQLDLRSYLPKPGSQGSQNSCTAWAVAYATKSYLEVRDQEWEADHPKRIFSPAFVYNQINGGRDRGSRIQDALNILIEQGCATLATMPYSEKNYTKTPSAQAFSEANKYKCKGFGTLKTGAEIRLALRQGQVVIVSVRTDPVFNSGMYPIFGTKERSKGVQSLESVTQHSYHAMVIVGYDDAQQAFLFMNSWGEQWGKGGYCWVSYDLVKSVAYSGTNLVCEAYVLFDIKNNQKEEAPVNVPIDKNISALGSVNYVGFEQNAHRWACRAWLNGSEQAFKNLQKIVWSLPSGSGNVVTYTRTNAIDSFMLHFTTYGEGNLTVKGLATFTDGSQKNVQYTFKLSKPSPQKRAVALVQSDRYWGQQNNNSFWEWTLKIQGNLTDLADIRQVTYHLHPTFSNPNPVVTQSASTGFAFSTTGWGVFPVKATVLFKDGTTLSLSKQLEFRDPIQNGLTLTNCAQQSGTQSNIYSWTLYLDGPLNLLREVQGVDYFLHPTFNPSQVRVTEGGEYGFPLSRSGWGVFTVTAKVYFKNGTSQDISHRLQFVEAPTNPVFQSEWK